MAFDLIKGGLSSLGVASYTNNSSNELTSTSNATYTYDYNGNTLTKVVGSNTTSYAWDFENRLTQKAYPDSTTAAYTCDLVSKILQVNDPTGTYAFAYDTSAALSAGNMGRLTGTTTTYSFLPNTPFTNSYSYDGDSNSGFGSPADSTESPKPDRTGPDD